MTTQPLQVSRESGPDGKVGSLYIFLNWKNVGYTPTKHMAIRHNWVLARLPDNFPFFDIPDAPGTNSNTPSFAAPQGSISFDPIKISITEAQEVLDKKREITMWGHADYWDVFKGTPMHTSQYCFIITGFYGNIYSTNVADTTVAMTVNCKTHNCHDDECKAQK